MRTLVYKKIIYTACFFSLLFYGKLALCQESDSSEKSKSFKNVFRYNLSGAMIFGVGKCVVFGYERVIRPHQTISVNFGKISMPEAIDINTDSFQLARESNSMGFNASIDYRFYLPKENKFLPPHGLYIGPYYSYNNFKKDNFFDYTGSGVGSNVKAHTDFTIHTIGFEMGYQVVLWKRLALDFLMGGPGLGFYDYKASFEDNLDPDAKKQIIDALDQALTQKFPGLNYVFSEEELSATGTLKTSAIGYRFLIQVGFNF